MNDKQLRQAMKRSGYTQERLAGELGMDRSTLNRKICSSGARFDLTEVCRITRALRLSRAEFLDIFFPEISMREG